MLADNFNVVASEGDIRTQGTQIAAEKGATFLASNNIELGAAENTYTQQANTSDKGFSLGDANKYLFGVHTQRENGDATQTQEVSTTISVGGNNQIVAQKVIFMLKVPKLCLRVKTNYLQRVMLF